MICIRLEALGFAHRIPHRGTSVRPRSITDLIDLYANQIPLEMLTVLKAAKKFTPEKADHAPGLLKSYRVLYERDPPAAVLATCSFIVVFTRQHGRPCCRGVSGR